MTENPETGTGWHGSRGRKAVWATAALMMLLPLLAMQVTDQVVWDIFDFALLGAMLVGVGVTIELAARKKNNPTYLSALGVALAAAFILVFVTFAVGIIGTENNTANLMFGGVLAEFLGLYCTLNSHTHLIVRGAEHGEVYEWEPKSGQQPLV